MTVLIIPSWYKTESNAILGSFFREQALMLERAGVEVIVADVTLQGRADWFSKRCFSLNTYSDEGVRTYSYVIPAMGIGRLESGGSEIVYYNLMKIYKKIISDGYKIDLIHAHSFMPAGIAAVKLGKKENIPVVVTEHSSAVLQKKLSRKRKVYFKSVIDEATEIICVSNALKKSVQDLTDNIRVPVVIPNAVNEKFKYKPDISEGKFSFISIGNLVQSKRFDLTIKAFSKRFKGENNVILKIIGGGVLQDKLEKLVEEQGIKNQVVFLGRISRQSVVEELQKSKVFVLPSDYETFGVVYVEAMACGLPIIGTKNGGSEDIIRESNGILIERDNVEELADAMHVLYEEYYQFNPQMIAKECQERFGEKTIVSQIKEIYHNYTKENRGMQE